MIYNKLTELIGRTPMLEISGFENQKARIIVKLEYFNPGGSVKDRIALAMIEDAESKGLLKPGATIIEPTSGNTGVGLAWVGAAKGYKTLGAKLELTPGAEGMKGAIAKAEELNKEIPGSIILGQFTNPANPAMHERTTGEEIWADTDGKVDIFVAGVGTGGTVTGVAKALKKHNPAVKAFAVEPASSAVLSTGVAGKHKIQGIGAGFVPATYDAAAIDKVITIADDEAILASRKLAAREGLLVGISSGASFAAALKLASDEANAGKTIVALLPDTGERYLSTVLYAFDEYPIKG